ncbi:MAG: T9SS C-terminal target domain-containing protein [Bacteroidia bacterium]|nr:MAG: T9SS C-terminal target domain-containing protein [Bacteroidia bacterium]
MRCILLLTTFFFSLNVFFLSNSVAQEVLPKWMTEEEKAIYPDYRANLPVPLSTNPPANSPRTPGEFEEAQAVIITWAAYSPELREIVRHAQSAVNVYIITSNQSWVQNYLISGNVPLDNIIFVNAPFNSVWVRDYGPQSVYLDGTDELAFIDWDYNRPRPQDNQVPNFMAGYLGLPIYQMALGSNLLTATGGNFMADGFGQGFSSKLILSENSGFTEAQIDQVMYDFKGIHTYIKMDELPFDNISHLDMHMKLLDEETLLVGEFPQGISDGPFIEANLAYLLSNYQTAYERPFNVVRVPMAPSPSGNYPPQAHYRTYTNSIILNNVVLVPVYGSYLDAEALTIYEEAMPGYEIVGINMNNVISASGAIHCVTREIAADDPIHIAHARILEADYVDVSYEVRANISNQAGVEEAFVYWKAGNGGAFEQLPMVLEEDTYYAHIPGQPCMTEVSYYISATNVNGKTINKPLVAPAGYYTFTVMGDAVDFIADPMAVTVGMPVTFHLTFCNEPETVSWHFGNGAEPSIASGTGPHEVIYNTSGGKTITLEYDGETIVKENYVVVNEENGYVVIINVEGTGTTEPEPGQYEIEGGEELEVVAIPGEGWKFVKWMVNHTESYYTDTLLINIENNANIVAIFDDITADIRPVADMLRYNIFPNPSSGSFTVSLSPFYEPVEMTIMDTRGQIIYEQSIAPSHWETLQSVELGNIPTGIYIVRFSTGREIQTGRIVIH